MDPGTLNTIIQMQLEDSEELARNAKGKQRQGTVSDAALALQMYTEELTACRATMTDRKMAQSVTLAILRDERLVHEAQLLERQAIRDRETAISLKAGDETNPHVPRAGQDTGKGEVNDTDVWEDPEMLSKVAAIYMIEPEFSSPPQLVSDSDTEEGTVAESSTWAAKRRTKDKPMLGHCVACGDDKDFFDVARVPCKNRHEYCKDCLAELFRLSMTDETLFPPRCCTEAIPLQHVRFFLPSDLAKNFEAQYAELSTKNRTYCHQRECSAFVPADAIVGEVATCPKCLSTTCTMCKDPSHTGDCPEDTALQQLVGTANAEQWQRCYQCNRFVELETGCNHMTCVPLSVSEVDEIADETVTGARVVRTFARSAPRNGVPVLARCGRRGGWKHELSRL